MSSKRTWQDVIQERENSCKDGDYLSATMLTEEQYKSWKDSGEFDWSKYRLDSNHFRLLQEDEAYRLRFFDKPSKIKYYTAPLSESDIMDVLKSLG